MDEKTDEKPNRPQTREDRFFNRDLSWLKFNAGVLEQAFAEDVPLIERLRFITIFENNLDEFYMIRVAGLRRMQLEGLTYGESPDQMPIPKTLSAINFRVRNLVNRKLAATKQVLQGLENHGVYIKRYDDLSSNQKAFLDDFYETKVFPVLTARALDSSHPFPRIANLGLHMIICFEPAEPGDERPVGFVEIPSILPGIVQIEDPQYRHCFVHLHDLVAKKLDTLFFGYKVRECKTFRVTRNLDYRLLESDVVNLLRSIQREMVNRDQQEAVRLEIDETISPDLLNILRSELDLEEKDVILLPDPIEIRHLSPILKLPLDDLKYPPFNPRLPPMLVSNKGIFSLLSKRDLLVHHPFESFYTVTEFLRAAANDPNVIAIKLTLYRTSGDSPIIESLIRAAENGKQVTAVIELKARFDEKNNIVWSRRLERAGVNVVFGFVGLKTHCKAALVVRKESEQLRRYVHLSTGNYNSQTARVYTDVGLLTSNDEIADDVSHLFNFLTGFNVFAEGHPSDLPKLKHLSVAPLTLRDKLIGMIDQEISSQKENGDGLIIAKMNALVDPTLIEKLYEASEAGVKIQLIVRGICCLRPGIHGMSENIEVTSIIDRFLEHTRIYYFHNHGNHDVYLSSADFMVRNMDRRIETLFPILDRGLVERILNDILHVYLADTAKARRLMPDGAYKAVKRMQSGDPASSFRAQEHLIQLVREEGIKSIPYEKAIRHGQEDKQSSHPFAKKFSAARPRKK